MPLNEAQLTALATEINTDPTGLGYAPHVASGADNAIVALLNQRRPEIDIRRDDVASREIIEAIAIGDYPALPANPNATALSTERRSLSWLEALSNIPMVRLLNDDGSNTPVIDNLAGMFPAGTGTRTRLLAVANRDGSRAEQLFGRNTFITDIDVARALRG